MPLESEIEDKVKDFAEHHFILHLKIVIWGRAGWPDHIFIKNGKVTFMEFKKPGEEPTPLQKHIHKMLRSEGVIVEVIDNVEAGYEALARML